MARRKSTDGAADPGETRDEEQGDVDETLVRMRKGSEEIEVHPTCVEAHRAVGWVEG